MALFLAHVGVPGPVVAGMRAQPSWAGFEALAPTLAYDDAALGDGGVPRELAARVGAPTLVLAGGAAPPFLDVAAGATARALPDAEHRTLEGQTHDPDPAVLAPVLASFFGGRAD